MAGKDELVILGEMTIGEAETKFISNLAESIPSPDVAKAIVKTATDIMKTDLEFIKNELKQKVGRDEFVFLEKRVGMIETKLNGLK